MAEKEMFKILSIDGGGMRGVIPSVLLSHIEKQTGKSIADLFDLIVGTSTGGIIAAMLTVKANAGAPKFSAAKILEFYKKYGKKIFKKSIMSKLMRLLGLRVPYDHGPLEKILLKNLGNSSLADCNPPVVMTSYDIERREPYFFKTEKASKNPTRNHYLRDAVRATTAGPTYFEPAPVDHMPAQGEAKRRVLVDGGVFVSNPAMCGYVEAASFCQSPESVLLLSLGTGISEDEIPYRKAKNWWSSGWVPRIVDITMDGQADATHYHLKKLLPSQGENQRYFRFDIDLGDPKRDGVPGDLDKTDDGHIKKLEAKAQQIIRRDAVELNRLIKKL